MFPALRILRPRRRCVRSEKKKREEIAAKAAAKRARKEARKQAKIAEKKARKLKEKEDKEREEKEKKAAPFGGMPLSDKMKRGLKKGGVEWVILELEKREQNTLGENIDVVKRLEKIFAEEKAIELEKMNKMKEEARLKREAEEAEAQAKAKQLREQSARMMLRKAEIREMREDEQEEKEEERLIDDRRGW